MLKVFSTGWIKIFYIFFAFVLYYRYHINQFIGGMYIKTLFRFILFIFIVLFIVTLPLQYNMEENIHPDLIINDAPPSHKEQKNTLPINDQKTAPTFTTQHLTFVTIGDSLTKGVGDETSQGGYVGVVHTTLLEEGKNVSIKNFGKEGIRSDQLLTHIQEDSISEALKDAQAVFITIGANDVMRIFKENMTKLTMDAFSKEHAPYAERLEKLFLYITEINPNGTIYLIGIYNPFKEFFKDVKELEVIVTKWNETSFHVTEQFTNVHFIPINDLFEESGLLYLSDDYFHPNHIGYRLIGKRIMQYIE